MLLKKINNTTVRSLFNSAVKKSIDLVSNDLSAKTFWSYNLSEVYLPKSFSWYWHPVQNNKFFVDR